jgi:cytochrome P450
MSLAIAIATTFAATAITIGLIIVAYRLYLHPLASVPGPRLAAVSTIYEAYYDLVRKGQLPWQLKKLHERYGPIVRIGPSEVHIHDPDFVLEHFSGAKMKWDKFAPHRQQLGVPNAVVSTVPHSLHQIRRGAVAPFLSATRVANTYRSVIIANVENVSARLADSKRSGSVIDLRQLFWYMSSDIITEIAFPKGTHLLDVPVLRSDYYHFQKGGQGMLLWFKHLPVLWSIFRSIPPAWMIKLEPQAAIPMKWEAVNKNIAKGILNGEDNCAKDTIIHHLYRSSLPQEEKDLERVWQESMSLVGAGGETVANTICTTIFYILQDRAIHTRLVNELKMVMPIDGRIPPLTALLSLPYLTATVQEGLRKAIGIISRFIRVSPSEPIFYQSYKMPPGTAVSYSTFLVNNSPDIFPEPDKFMPERWLEAENKELTRRRRLVLTLGTGSRRCLGEHLATAEITYVLAILFHRFDFDLYNTTESDVRPRHDSLMPLPMRCSKGIRVRVK